LVCAQLRIALRCTPQVIEVLLRPNKQSTVLVNLEHSREKNFSSKFKGPKHMCPKDGCESPTRGPPSGVSAQARAGLF
jgi:hypothetical protein